VPFHLSRHRVLFLSHVCYPYVDISNSWVAKGKSKQKVTTSKSTSKKKSSTKKTNNVKRQRTNNNDTDIVDGHVDAVGIDEKKKSKKSKTSPSSSEKKSKHIKHS
jgi:L,D-peptidoglycan transpeptidase YkuD (ErfK/YbiS/YcfS/YnhG family)